MEDSFAFAGGYEELDTEDVHQAHHAHHHMGGLDELTVSHHHHQQHQHQDLDIDLDGSHGAYDSFFPSEEAFYA